MRTSKSTPFDFAWGKWSCYSFCLNVFRLNSSLPGIFWSEAPRISSASSRIDFPPCLIRSISSSISSILFSFPFSLMSSDNPIIPPAAHEYHDWLYAEYPLSRLFLFEVPEPVLCFRACWQSPWQLFLSSSTFSGDKSFSCVSSTQSAPRLLPRAVLNGIPK